MRARAFTLLFIGLAALPGFAKDKNKNVLPAYVLAAHTVAVIIDPGAGISIEDPRANQVARENVEKALVDWGRLEPAVSTQIADLIIVIRKGNGRLVNETIPDVRQNSRPGSIYQNDSTVGGSAQRGGSPGLSQNPDPGANPRNPDPQAEIGEEEDTLLVYRGGVEHPLDAPSAWRYRAKDGLQAPSVPAIASFRKAVADAEKAAAKHP